MTALIMINVMMSALFVMMNHPLSMGLILLLQTTLISLISGNMNYNFWYSYILFLIMIGGMLILFMYMTSIASNEKFKFNSKMIAIITVIPLLAITMNIYADLATKNKEIMNFNSSNMIQLSMNKFINFPLNMVLAFMMIYLFLTLVATVKITAFKSGSLRQMNN